MRAGDHSPEATELLTQSVGPVPCTGVPGLRPQGSNQDNLRPVGTAGRLTHEDDDDNDGVTIVIMLLTIAT